MVPSLFIYGTLLDNVVFYKVLRLDSNPNYDQKITKRSAHVKGYKRFRVKNAVYPAMVVGSDDDQVVGCVIDGLSEYQLNLLDQFEGSDYKLQSVTCTLNETDEVIPAITYIWIASLSLISDQLWDLETFQRAHLITWLQDTDEFPE